MKQMLVHIISCNDWKAGLNTKLPFIRMNLNGTQHRTTHFTLFKLSFSRCEAKVMMKPEEDLKSTSITGGIGFDIGGCVRMLISGIHKLIYKHITDDLTDEPVPICARHITFWGHILVSIYNLKCGSTT